MLGLRVAFETSASFDVHIWTRERLQNVSEERPHLRGPGGGGHQTNCAVGDEAVCSRWSCVVFRVRWVSRPSICSAGCSRGSAAAAFRLRFPISRNRFRFHNRRGRALACVRVWTGPLGSKPGLCVCVCLWDVEDAFRQLEQVCGGERWEKSH